MSDKSAYYHGTIPPNAFLPKTGQTTSYVDYDDGWYEAGSPASPRFVDNGDGTISDRATGLMWVKNPATVSGVGFDFSSGYVWFSVGTFPALDAITAMNTAGYLGHSDWRLPNVKELHSILDYGASGPSIDPVFSVAVELYYWSSTTRNGGSSDAWAVDFYDGYVNALSKNGSYSIRPVRGGI